ncbi:MAG: SCO family protein [Verrucomicrobiales bacterium]|nr:SCO family protein [Verrucomicrobiales bacterium]
MKISEPRSTPAPRRRISWRPLLILIPLALSSCEPPRPNSGVTMGEFRDVADFSFTTQEGESLSRNELKGKIWIANFIFTSCAAECLVLSSRLAELQMHYRDYEDVAFVSFSVDPQSDTPERLHQYAGKWHANPERWHFLTGDTTAIDDIVVNSFLLPATRDPVEAGKLFSETLIHSSRFAIVDRTGKVRAYVDGMPPESVQTISQIIMQLLQEPLPTSTDQT